jgi:hypothetical protein
MVVKYNQRSIWIPPFREHRDAPLGGYCGKMMKLDGREPTINATPHLLQHSMRIPDTEQFWFEELRNWVRPYDTTWH